MKISNAFSLNMLKHLDAKLVIKPVSIEDAAALARSAYSVVGHKDTAAIFSSVLGVTVKFNRESVLLKKRDTLLVGQYKGPRLPEGASHLPDGATIEWCTVTLI